MNTGPSSYPVLVAAGQPVAEWLKPIPGESGNFRTDGVGHTRTNPETPADVTFTPLYRTHRRTYGIYWEPAAGLKTSEDKYFRVNIKLPDWNQDVFVISISKILFRIPAATQRFNSRNTRF
ncbi:MAG: hypothetical protein JW715_13640 [Sedimentisphaerales bacterium]|nr:hypothetical protein [Sedimentisphaerales bacterium]